MSDVIQLGPEINNHISTVEFGAVERIVNPTEYDEVYFDEALGIYTPPIEPSNLSNMIMANSYHGAIIEARARIIAKDFIENEYLSFTEFMLSLIHI